MPVKPRGASLGPRDTLSEGLYLGLWLWDSQSRGRAFSTGALAPAITLLAERSLLSSSSSEETSTPVHCPKPRARTGLSRWYGAGQGCCGQCFLAPRGGRGKRQAQTVSCQPRCRPRTRDTLGSQRPGWATAPLCWPRTSGQCPGSRPGLCFHLLSEGSRPDPQILGRGQSVSEASLTPTLGLGVGRGRSW